MIDKLEAFEKQALDELENAGSKEALVQLKTRYLGRKGLVASLFKQMSALPAADRGVAGEKINSIKNHIERTVEAGLKLVEDAASRERLGAEKIDVTLPGRSEPLGRRHPVTLVMDEVEAIFLSLGFSIAEGPEVENDYYNFEALNVPKDHPARDMQDTFYISPDVLLRTHTSPVQIRVMESAEPPLAVIVPGTVYRRDSDVTHTPMFHQVEGFMVDRGINFAHLKGVLTHFLHRLFGPDTRLRFRPSFFPFTEPSAEVDIGCVMCAGDGCRVCKGSGWLEILGCGMIHPAVFRSVKYDSETFTGFAFGLGIERIAMLKFGIDDIRLFFENDVRFLGQFQSL